MRRSFTEVLRQESPIALAREAVWRTRKGWHRNRVLARIEEYPCPVEFRRVPYYAPDAPSLSDTSRALITGYADEICDGRFPFLGYGTRELGREPKWNVAVGSFVSANCQTIRPPRNSTESTSKSKLRSARWFNWQAASSIKTTGPGLFFAGWKTKTRGVAPLRTRRD